MRKFQILLLLVSFSISSIVANASLIVPPGEPDPAKVKAAIAEFKNLPRKERKERVREVKLHMKDLKKLKKEGRAEEVEKVVLIILAILLPPLAVYLHQGEINSKFWISLLLTFLFILPGIIYALLVVLDEI